MPPRPTEDMPQREFLLRLRAAIDTAIKYPSKQNVDTAVSLAAAHPRAMRSGHIGQNLNNTRWSWLHDHGIVPVWEDAEIAGQPAAKATYTPELQT